MIKNYALSTDKKLEPSDTLTNFTHILKPTREEIGQVSEYFDFPFDYLGGILDDFEQARFETDSHDNNLILLQYPATSEEGEVEIFPYSLIWTKDESVILAHNHEVEATDVFTRTYDLKRYKHQIIYQIMSQMMHTFQTHLQEFRLHNKQLEKSIKNSTKNDQIIEMIVIQESLIYFEFALKNNKDVLQKFIAYLREEDEDGWADRIYDIYVDADQAYTETIIQLKLLENLRDLFSNIVSNNLNIVMKIMTSATFVLGIPTLISGFYGMNVHIPGQAIPWMLLPIVIVMLAATIGVSWWLKKKDMM
ncbi:MAG: magnesium transporter CorA family protein [Streptococcaceae bacterium]|nr:magnesium transporter CorA family protein [Streptococcaceae bacterium]